MALLLVLGWVLLRDPDGFGLTGVGREWAAVLRLLLLVGWMLCVATLTASGRPGVRSYASIDLAHPELCPRLSKRNDSFLRTLVDTCCGEWKSNSNRMWPSPLSSSVKKASGPDLWEPRGSNPPGPPGHGLP